MIKINNYTQLDIWWHFYEIRYEFYTHVEQSADPVCVVREETMEYEPCFVVVVNTPEL
jgi:hypothetical protein